MLLTRFMKECRASVIPLFGLAAIPLITAVGAAVDYSHANAVRTAMQSALDSTALMLSKEAQGLNGEQLIVKAGQYFNALFIRPDAMNVTVTSILTIPQEGSFKLDVKSTASVATTFVRVLGQDKIDISSSSQVLWGIKKLELALVLDNTGSMSSSGKMTALKEAAHNLLTTLQNAAKEDGDIKVSIVPFATDVNLGASGISGDLIDWTDWETKNGTCSSGWYSNKNSCESNGHTWTPSPHSAWNGCVWDRDQNNDVLNTLPVAGSTSTMYPAHQVSSCSTAMMPLSYDWTALNSKIDQMTPTGYTNTTIGLVLGWQTLTSAGPFANAAPAAADLDKVIVMLTDGQNTQNRWTSSQSSIDARTQAVCANIKAENIKIYTVRVINGNASLLQNCATKPDMYYDVDAASELNSVFSSIAQNLANLRIAK